MRTLYLHLALMSHNVSKSLWCKACLMFIFSNTRVYVKSHAMFWLQHKRKILLMHIWLTKVYTQMGNTISDPVSTLCQYSYKELEGATNVQNRLDASRDHCNGSPPELRQICTDVQTWRNNHWLSGDSLLNLLSWQLWWLPSCSMPSYGHYSLDHICDCITALMSVHVIKSRLT